MLPSCTVCGTVDPFAELVPQEVKFGFISNTLGDWYCADDYECFRRSLMRMRS